MKVLIAAPLLSKPGGVSHYIRALLPALQTDVRSIAVGSRDDHDGVARNAGRFLADNLAFIRNLYQYAPDLVHLNPSLGWKAVVRDALLLRIAKLFRKSVVITIHGWDENFEHRYLHRYPWLFPLLFGSADCVIVLGSRFEDKLRRLGYQNPVFQLAAPVEPDFFCAAPGTCPKQNLTILFLARLEPAKGIYEALDAYVLLKKAFPSARLIVAGEGVERSRATEYAENLGVSGINFTGHLQGPEKLNAFRSAALYLFPSHTEGMPISVLEAMACGLPVVTSRVGGIPDFFVDGVMGYMSPDLRPETFASLATLILENAGLQERIRVHNSQYARDHFTPASVAAALDRIYWLQGAAAY